MNEHLKSLNQSYVFAYIVNYQPYGNDVGVMTIVDNSANNITSLLSKYGFYIDDIFIAGGYGFKTLDEIKNSTYIQSTYQAVYLDLSKRIEDLNNKNTIFVFKGIENSESGDHQTNLNIISPEYNSYNFITSYNYFKLDEEDVQGSLDYKYTLSLKSQRDFHYINNITLNSLSDVIEVDNINTINTQKYQVEIKISQNTSSNILTYNDDIKLYLYSKLSEEHKNTSIEYSKSTTNWVATYSFNKPTNSFDDDLVLEFRKPTENENEEKIIYSYIIPNFLRWQDKLIIYPLSNDSTSNQLVENLNNYNFRSDETDISNGDCHDVYEEFVTIKYIRANSDNFINVDTNNEIELNFSSNTPSYDYIIFRNLYNIDFSFNGIKSLNWQYKSIIINNKEYYIWQSPQRYFGNHTWKIKISI